MCGMGGDLEEGGNDLGGSGWERFGYVRLGRIGGGII